MGQRVSSKYQIPASRKTMVGHAKYSKAPPMRGGGEQRTLQP